jgi:multiple sugar transport system substrate-binding protein
MAHRFAFWRPAAVLAVLTIVATACAPANPSGTSGGAVHLNFMVWSYGIDTIQDNIKKFEASNSNVTVSLADTSWFNYHDTMATKFAAGGAPDVAYSSDHWLREWVAAGWIVPIDQYCPSLASYKSEWAPYALQGMTLNNHVYGLPYYADLVIFLYNDKLLKQAGFNSPPATWEELTAQAQAIKAKGISQYPIDIPMKKDDPWTIEIFYSMVYGRGGHMFDSGTNPVFGQAGGPAEQTLTWLRSAYASKLLDPAVFESAEPDVVKTTGEGQHVFTVLAKYNLAELNQGQHSQKGNFKMALMPGSSHSTVGFVRFYALTKAAVAHGQGAITASCNFLQYFGGKTGGEYKVVKRWALEKGLGFANLPLYDDPQVSAAINAWGNVDLERQQAQVANVKEGLTPWWGQWDIYAREQIDNAVSGSSPPTQVLQNMTTKWAQLKT